MPMVSRKRGVSQQSVDVKSSVALDVGIGSGEFSALLDLQTESLGELASIKKLIKLSKEKEQQDKNNNAGIASDKIQLEMFELAKENIKGQRKYWKSQEEFQKEWDKEAKDIAEMAKGMKMFKSAGEKFKDKVEGVKEKYGIANGGLKKTVLGALNVGGVFNKTLERDEFVKKQKALGSTASTKDLKADYEGARKATHEINKNEKAISAHMKQAGTTNEDFLKGESPEFAALLAKRQSSTENLSKYDRSTREFSPDKKNAELAGLLPKTATAAASLAQTSENAEESQRMSEEELNLLKSIAENTGGTHKNAGDKKPDEKKPEGGGLLDSMFSVLSSGLMNAFKALLNPGAILKALGKVFAIGMIVGALFEGIMDGFDEFMETGDIGKALIAGLAGIIDFLTFGLFDKDKIKEVIGDFSDWTYEHLVKPFVDFISAVKDSFMGFIEKIGIPEIVLADNKITGKVSIGPYYPFKSDANPETATPTAAAPTSASQVETRSAENAGAKETPASNNIVNAPSTNINTSSTQSNVIRSPIKNEESSLNRYIGSRYAAR